MWLGIVLASLVWCEGTKHEQKMYIPIIIVATIGLIISFSNKSRKERVIEKIREDMKNKEIVKK